MNTKIILIIFISLLILTSGCINTNVTPQQKTQSIDTSLLDSSKVILSELEMKETLGADWNKNESQNNNSVYSAILFEKQNTSYITPPKASIILFVLPNITMANQFYEKPFPDFNETPTGNIDIGDSGKIYQTEDASMIIFRINTIVTIASTSTDLNNTENLARKQVAKINNILNSLS